MILSALVMDKTQNPPLVILALGLVQLFAYIVFYVWSNNDLFLDSVHSFVGNNQEWYLLMLR